MTKQFVFIGDYDKTDLLFYISKLLGADKKVLLADMTRHHRYRYSYPKIETEAKIQQYDNFDVYEELNSITELHQLDSEESFSYDYLLIDIDDPERIHGLVPSDGWYLVTSYEKPVLEENALLLKALARDKAEQQPVKLTAIIYEVNATFTEDYLVRLYNDLPLEWHEPLVYIPDERDMTRKINNQFSSTVSLKKLSPDLRSVIQSVVHSITGMDRKQIQALWKQAERGN
ncbi:hypothetical protein AWM70_12650 [Paenibacillus yonginensis]|uniref:Uncharacterized protein n=1 Tax=Paenibacillus yonginensis TaxID=1462996 RepID=A0A1B1N1R4_9BACL|nr:hypothetical protein [Paenibacillus yonginensis]ANS75353.1 hypothetical protein AWM70_12650 [Paenibacillus yonginensis]